MAGRRIEREPGRHFQAAEEVVLGVADGVLDLAFFMSSANATGADLETVMAGEIQIARIKLSRLAPGMTQDRRLTVIDVMCPTPLCGRNASGSIPGACPCG